MLEKSLQMINIEPAECTPALVYKVAVLAVADPPFAKVPILLSLTFCVPVEESATLLLIKIQTPVVFTFIQVSVLPLMFCDKVANELII
jgi:hypothetical protein